MMEPKKNHVLNAQFRTLAILWRIMTLVPFIGSQLKVFIIPARLLLSHRNGRGSLEDIDNMAQTCLHHLGRLAHSA